MWPFRSTRDHVAELRKKRSAQHDAAPSWYAPQLVGGECTTSISAEFTSRMVRISVSVDGYEVATIRQSVACAVLTRDAMTRAIEALTTKDEGVDITDQVEKEAGGGE